MAIGAIPAPNEPRNKLLSILSLSERQRIRDDLEPVQLRLGQILIEAGSAVQYVYLPVDSTLSLVHLMADGGSTEIAAVGSEGMVGLSVVMGGHTMATRAVVQSAGWAHRMASGALVREFERGGGLQRVLLLYAQAHLTVVAQTAVCNQRHSVDQRLTRWLLMGFDRIQSNEMFVTHESLSNSVGVRREGITEATGRMQRAGLLISGRGKLTILDRVGLQATGCECYEAICRENERLFPGRRASTSLRGRDQQWRSGRASDQLATV